MKREWAKKFQGALDVISNAARTTVYRSNPLPSQCRNCLSVVKNGGVVPDGDAHGMIVSQFLDEDEIKGKGETIQKHEDESSIV